MMTQKIYSKLEVNLSKRLGIKPEKLEEICQQWGIVELALFGSVLREDFNANSDLDFLVTFELESKVSLLDLETLEQQFKTLFNRPVDLVTKKSIEKSDNWIRRQNILDHSEVIYVKR